MLIPPSIAECIGIAVGALTTKDIPAVVFYDSYTSTVLAEAAARFVKRPDFASHRYKVFMRIEEGFISVASAIANTADCPKGVIDITTKHSSHPDAPSLHLRDLR